MNQLFQYSPDKSFDYIVKRQRRKTMALHVMPDATVEVRVPKWVPKRDWIKFLEERADWVIQQQLTVLEKLNSQPGFFQGECHRYLGIKYPLDITYAAKSNVIFKDNVLHIHCRNPEEPIVVQKALEKWYRQQAKEVFNERMRYCYSLFPQTFQNKYVVPTITLRVMRRRWGSCSLNGDVTLNMQLITMPLQCIDYVIAHELCHLEVFNHNPDFYELLVRVMPDWKRRRQVLEAQS